MEHGESIEQVGIVDDVCSLGHGGGTDLNEYWISHSCGPGGSRDSGLEFCLGLWNDGGWSGRDGVRRL